MKHTLDDIPALVKSAWGAAKEGGYQDFLIERSAKEIATDMVASDAFIEGLMDDHHYDTVYPLVVTEVEKLKNDM